MSTVSIVVYCNRCDYFLKTAVMRDAIGTHGCATCGSRMEVYVPQELARPDHEYSPPTATAREGEPGE